MGYVVSAVERVLEQPTCHSVEMAWETVLLMGPFWAAALLGPLLGWASPLPLQRTRQGGIHLLPALLADLP